MSIQFGNAVSREPQSLSSCTPLYRAGLYAILVYDPFAKPRPYSVLYFGQSSNFSERAFPSGHHAYTCWIARAGSASGLYVATYEMPNSSVAYRVALESQLVDQYIPPCNL